MQWRRGGGRLLQQRQWTRTKEELGKTTRPGFNVSKVFISIELLLTTRPARSLSLCLVWFFPVALRSAPQRRTKKGVMASITQSPMEILNQPRNDPNTRRQPMESPTVSHVIMYPLRIMSKPRLQGKRLVSSRCRVCCMLCDATWSFQPPKRCPKCRQFLDDPSLKVFIGDPENAVSGTTI